MKTNILLVALMFVATIAFSQTKESKSDEKPLRKIASGNGNQRINEEVEREVAKAMVELEDLDIKIDLRALENLDEQIERSLEGLDETVERSVNASLEGLDETIEHTVNSSLRGLDVQINESIEQSLKVLEHLDININFNDDNFDSDGSIEEFRRKALRDDSQKPAPKQDPKKKD